MTKVVDMRNGGKRSFEYDLPPKQAVIACYEQQERKNFNTWTYPEEDHPKLQEGSYYFFCGNYAAKKFTVTVWP